MLYNEKENFFYSFSGVEIFRDDFKYSFLDDREVVLCYFVIFFLQRVLCVGIKKKIKKLEC